ncbi:MAG: hypothetical protein JXX28_13835 [Deltaproteobacteria bacterium]|nr:hypothetical protein [Deltaproteobacteria bacterium]
MPDTPLFIDKDVRALLAVVHDASARGRQHRAARSLFDTSLHPRGIKELAEPPAMRIATALVELLGSLERGSPVDRLRALRSVNQEVLHNGSHLFRLNTARVLLEVMKDLLRSEGNDARQAGLARDFIDATSGRPRLIRTLLRRYRLVEMPEAWTQIAYDHRVHDANSTGRKTPTHLIMDAWIKGIRYLGVVYYNHIPIEAAEELLEAGEVMGVEVRVGMDLTVRMRNKRARLMLFPRGFRGKRAYLDHLRKPATQAFMLEGRKVTDRFHAHVLSLVDRFNAVHRPALCASLHLTLPPIDRAAFEDFVGSGQASRLHLAEFIHQALLPHLRGRAREIAGDPAAAEQLAALDALVPEEIKARFLSAAANPDLPDPMQVADDPEAPELLRVDLEGLLDRVRTLPCGIRVVLSPSGLTVAEVLDLLYQGDGRITHLELFNLREHAEGTDPDLEAINRLRRVLNRGNIVELKRIVLDAIHDADAEMAERLRVILADLPSLQRLYSQGERLRSRLGTGSTGRSRVSRGMGMVVLPTLGLRGRREVRREGRMLPLRTTAVLEQRYTPLTKVRVLHGLPRFPLIWRAACSRDTRWTVAPNTTHYMDDETGQGNIAALGGAPEERGNGLIHHAPARRRRSLRALWRLLPGKVQQLSKVGIGFLPAFLTFWLTKDWWLLAWFGAVIWFAITGSRNIIQSVVGGGGVFRSPLLRWNDLVSWGRVADSLLYTGFSVPLLDFLVKYQLLQQTLGVTVTSAPWELYTVMALANGVYISSHNALRGLPPAAIVGNFFRSILSIPVAFALSWALLHGLIWLGLPLEHIEEMLQLGAAVISKAASDTVAGIIEGSADRAQNLSRARADFQEKLQHLTEIHGRLEMLFPEEDVLELLERPKKLVKAVQTESDELFRQATIAALDLMYFWYYQPRAQAVYRRALQRMSPEERLVVLGLQRVLERKRVITEMFLAGLVGRRFEGALGFYLNRADAYLAAVRRLG